jgi:hypothetical protein
MLLHLSGGAMMRKAIKCIGMPGRSCAIQKVNEVWDSEMSTLLI